MSICLAQDSVYLCVCEREVGGSGEWGGSFGNGTQRAYLLRTWPSIEKLGEGLAEGVLKTERQGAECLGWSLGFTPPLILL